MIQESLFKRASFILAAGMLLGAFAGCSSNSGPTNPNPPSPTNTPPPTFTSGPSLTPTPTSTSTLTFTPTWTGTSTNTHTPVPSATSTSTGTPTSTNSSTSTATSSFSSTPTASSTPTGTPTASFTATNSPTATGTPTITPTPTSTFSPTLTPTKTNSPTVTSTSTPTFTSTPTPTPNATACGAFSPFGNNTSSPTTYVSAAGLLPEMMYSSFNLSQTSTLWDIQVNLSTDNYPMTMQAGIYNQDTGQLVAASAQQNVTTTPSLTWVKFNMPSPKTLVPGNYILAFLQVNNQVGNPAPLLGGNTGGNDLYDVRSSAGFTPTFSSSGASQLGGTLEIYADVCGAPPTPTPTFFATPCSTKAFLGSQAYSTLGSNAVSELVYSSFTLAGSDSFVLWDVQASLNTYSTSVATYQVAVYNQTSGALVGESAQQSVSTSSATQWVQFNMTQPQTLVPGSYLLALWMPSSNAPDQELGQSPYGSNFNIIGTYSGFTSTFNNSGSLNYSGTLGIYAETCALNPTPTPAVIPTPCTTPSVFGDKTYFDSGTINPDEFHYAVFNQPGPGNETLFDVNVLVGNGSAGYPITLQAGVYDQGSGNLLGTSAVTALDNSGHGINWTQLNLSYPQTLVPGNYILGVWAIGANGAGNIISDPSGPNNHNIVPAFSGFSSTFNNAGQTNGIETLSIYGDICP